MITGQSLFWDRVALIAHLRQRATKCNNTKRHKIRRQRHGPQQHPGMSKSRSTSSGNTPVSLENSHKVFVFDLQSTTNSFIIETLGPLTMEKTCFRNNAVGVSNVAVFGSSFSNKENFATNSTGDLCEFASVFENLQQFDSFSPLCVSTGSNVCLAGATSAPTTTPSAAPSASPTEVPSASPTGQPTLSPAPTIVGTTPSPTVQPTNFQPPIGFAFPTEPPASSSGASWIRVSGVSTLLAGALLFL